ncbi:MAG: alcohol dehydrogenase catalytic domain-containing protein [Prolixibacteraceae bacterium]|nr:alcohol dehydrogenase catalytic domain-containing protein [Prolixibacteraceae bacterium]
MKAMVLTGIRQMEMRELPMPEIKANTDVLIAMKVVGVCGSDVHYYTKGKIGSQVVQYPFPVGHEGAGEVVEVGSAVSRVKPGDRIAIEPAMPCGQCDQCEVGRPHTCRKLRFLGCPGQADGCLTEFLVMPETSCFPISDRLSYTEAAISEPLAIGLYAVNQSILLKNASIGILGFGPIGMSVLLSAMAKGATNIFVTDLVDERLRIAKKGGAVYTGNPGKEDVVTGIKTKEPLLLDVVFECCGKQEAIDQAVELLKPGGKLMVIGIPEFDRWSFPVDQMRHKEICVQNVRRQNHALEETLELLTSGKIAIGNMATHRFPFSRTKEAFDLVSEYRDGVMKAMVDFNYK